MLKAQDEGITPEQLDRARRRARTSRTGSGFHISFDHCALDAFAGERRTRAGDLPRSCATAGLADRDEAGRTVLRSGARACSSPTATSRATCPKCRREGPVRRCVRGVRLDLCAHRSHRPLLDAVRRASRSCEPSEHLLLPAVRSRGSRARSSSAGPKENAAAARGVQQEPGVAGSQAGRRQRADTTGTSRAKRPYFGIPSCRTRRASSSTSGSTRPSAT